MAERRMFAKTIIDSDAFLDMPVTARLLYYDLGMRADDDGFINSPKKIMRITGASSDDMNILIMRKFIIPFDSGVVVIKHWRIHNYIRKDTYVETKYKDEKEQLMLDENNAYTAKKMQLLQLRDEYVDESSTQVRLGKDSIGKDSIGKDSIEKNIGDATAPHTQVETVIQEKNSETAARKKREQFIKPTVEEIEKFAHEYNLTKLDPQYFYDYYESNGWMVGKNHMKDWKATAKNWNRRQFNTSRQRGNVIKMPDYMREQVDARTFGDLEKEGKCPF
mgnify:FL=1